MIAPSKATAVVGDRPAFSWPARRADVVYHFILIDVDTGSTILDQTVRAAQLAMPADRPALARGHYYQWLVVAQTPDKKPHRIDAEFSVLDADTAQTLAQLAPCR